MLPTKYDSFIERYRDKAPLAFIKALIRGESGFRPKGQTGSYRGLMQVGERNVLKDYNERNRTNIAPEQLFDPETCIKIGCDTINRIITGYSAYPTLRVDWTERTAGLVMFGWNAGYSRAAGVQYVAGILQDKGFQPEQVTIDSIGKAARDGSAPKAVVYLASAAKQSYCKKVARWYSEERGLKSPDPVEDMLANVGWYQAPDTKTVAIGGLLVGLSLLI